MVLFPSPRERSERWGGNGSVPGAEMKNGTVLGPDGRQRHRTAGKREKAIDAQDRYREGAGAEHHGVSEGIRAGDRRAREAAHRRCRRTDPVRRQHLPHQAGLGLGAAPLARAGGRVHLHARGRTRAQGERRRDRAQAGRRRGLQGRQRQRALPDQPLRSRRGLSRSRHAREVGARALSRRRLHDGARRAPAGAFSASRASRSRIERGEPINGLRQFQARHRRRRHRARHLGRARPLDERDRRQGHRGTVRHHRDGRERRRHQGRGHHLGQGRVLRRRRPHHAGDVRPPIRRRGQGARRGGGRGAPVRGEPQVVGALPAPRDLRQAVGGGDQRHRARRRLRAHASPAIIASRPTIPARASACPRSRSGSFPAPAAPSASRA